MSCAWRTGATTINENPRQPRQSLRVYPVVFLPALPDQPHVARMRSAVAVPGETPECQSPDGSDADPGALRAGAGGLAKSYGERLLGCNVRNMNPEKAEGLSPGLQARSGAVAGGHRIQIREYNERIEALAERSYPQVALLKQLKGMGTLIALTFLLTLEDPHRVRKSRDVDCYPGLQPGRRNLMAPIFSSWGLHFHLMGSPFSLNPTPFSFQTLTHSHHHQQNCG
jgi:transposase IS116/IS110/IS902 family protein